MDKLNNSDGLIIENELLISNLSDNNPYIKDEEYYRHLASIVESSEDAIISKSLDGTIKSWNKGGEKMFGYTANEAIGKNISFIIPTDYINEEKKIIEWIQQNKIIDHYETVRNKKNGDQIYVSLTVSPIKDEAGKIIGVSKIARDITHRKKFEAALLIANKELSYHKGDKENRAARLVIANKELLYQNKEKEKRAAELVIAYKELDFQSEEKENRATELIIANKELLYQNKEKENRAAELITANNELIYQKKEKEKCAAELVIANEELLFQNEEKEQRAAELEIANKELLFQNKEKEIRAAELVIANKELLFQNSEKEKRAAELIIANKELLYQNGEKENRAAELVIANKELLFQNEEKEKRAAEFVIANKELLYLNEEKIKQATELAEANKELESFTYSVSHDLRTPLRAINGFTQILVEDYKEQLDDKAQDVLNEVIANSNKMGQLIDDLLNFSRIAKQHVSMVTINIKHMIDNAIAELKPMYPNRIINVILKNPENIKGDSNMLKQVFINLISNAFKYTGKKEEAMVEIGSYCKNDYCTYYVKDNGAGFDMNYYDKLFGVFQRLHSTNEFEGTGVGLAIIQKIVTKHGGKVWAEGKVNEGACFYVSLPVLETE